MNDTKEPIIILLVLFVLVGLAYGPYKNSIKNRPTQTNTPDSTIGQSSGNQVQSVGYTPNKYIADDIKDVESKIKTLDDTLSKQNGTTYNSPFYNKVRMSNITNLNNSDPSSEYFQLSTNLQKSETVDITGWYIRSVKTGYTVVIGQASLLPFPFTKNYNDVVLQYNDRAYIVKGFSPIGISFRTNICTGYFGEGRTFRPSLPTECPLARNESLPKFSSVLDDNDECVSEIERISRCSTVNTAYTRNLPDTVPASCINYMLTQVNYNTCVANHFDDTDFPGNQYYVYLNKFGPLWRNRDEKINLYDRNGLVVDTLSY